VKKFAAIAVWLAPMVLLAQLPMLLNRGGAQLIGVPPNQAFTSYVGDVASFYGDSVTVGYNPNPPFTDTPNRFSTLLCAQYSMVESNYGVGGSQIADAGEADQITANTAISNTNVSVWLAGYNDVFYFGNNAAALTDNQAAVESLAAWLALPAAVRVPWNATGNFPNPGNIYYSPGWVFLPTTLGGVAGSTQAGASASFFFLGDTLLIGTARASSGAGDATLIIGDLVNNDFIPTQTNHYSCVRNSPDTAQGRNYSAGLIVITNLSTTATHGAIFSADTAANTFFCWFASYSTNQLPKVVLSGTLQPAGAQYANPNLPANFQNGSTLAATQYSQMTSNVAARLSAVRLNVKWVPAPLLDSSTDYYFDGIHPNDSGHLKIKNVVQTAF
jgi:hypothetical protein